MAYIGNQPTDNFVTFATQNFSTSATSSYTLDHAVSNENEIALFINNVRQHPGSGKAYTATGTALTLSENTASTDVMYCIFLGRAIQSTVPSTNSITAAMIGNTAISGKDALTSEPADTDEFLVSDAGTLKRIDYSLIKGGGLIKLASTTISSAVAAVAFDNTVITSTHDNYKLICTGLTAASDNQDIGMRMSVDNGSNFATHVGGWNYTQIDSGSSDQTGSLGNKNYIPFGSDEEADADGGVNVDLTIWNVNSTSQYKYANGLVTAVNQNGNYYAYRVHGYIASNTAVNYLKVFTSEGGNLDTGTCTLYGFEK